MTNLVAESEGNKGKMSHFVETFWHEKPISVTHLFRTFILQKAMEKFAALRNNKISPKGNKIRVLLMSRVESQGSMVNLQGGLGFHL